MWQKLYNILGKQSKNVSWEGILRWLVRRHLIVSQSFPMTQVRCPFFFVRLCHPNLPRPLPRNKGSMNAFLVSLPDTVSQNADAMAVAAGLWSAHCFDKFTEGWVMRSGGHKRGRRLTFPFSHCFLFTLFHFFPFPFLSFRIYFSLLYELNDNINGQFPFLKSK